MEGGLPLNIVVGECATVLELLSSKDESLLFGCNTFYLSDLDFDVIDSPSRDIDVEGNSLASQSFDEDDRSAGSKTEDKMEGGLPLNIVVGERVAILKLLSSEDKSLLIERDTLLVLDLGFEALDGVRGLSFKSDGLAT